jgi:hydrogenase nickel incorporation protein HypB
VLSVTEGEDKPVKYPLMFRESDAAILNKTDLLPHLDYDREAAVGFIRQVHPGMPVFELSARTGEGLDAWIGWIQERIQRKNNG